MNPHQRCLQAITLWQVAYRILKSHINQYISSKQQERWLSCPDNKLLKEKPTLGERPHGLGNLVERKLFLSRLRFGHTYFSHSYSLRQDDPLECTACQVIYSVRQVLIDCIDLGLTRPRSRREVIIGYYYC